MSRNWNKRSFTTALLAILLAAVTSMSACSKKQGQQQGQPVNGDASGGSGVEQAPAAGKSVDGSSAEGSSAESGSPQSNAAGSKSAPEVSLSRAQPIVPQTGLSLPSLPSTPTAMAPAMPAAPKAPEPQCFTVAYRHKELARHSSDEACSRHQNTIKLPQTKVNPSSVCVRVNGTPVAFQWMKGKGDELVIGPIAGPRSKILVRYCIGKAKCAEECKIPRDEFMDAIGGAEPAGAQIGKWDDSQDKGEDVDSHLNNELKKELADMEGKGDVFKDWLADEEVPACGVKRAVASSEGSS